MWQHATCTITTHDVIGDMRVGTTTTTTNNDHFEREAKKVEDQG
jgi:hypothetical protein